MQQPVAKNVHGNRPTPFSWTLTPFSLRPNKQYARDPAKIRVNALIKMENGVRTRTTLKSRPPGERVGDVSA